MPSIAVIIPVYNTSAYLERCLLSIVGQTFRDFEAICVDDGSTDNSCDIINGFARRDPRIKLIKHAVNLGAGGARNTGIKASKSTYIAFVDSDDYVDNDLLREAYQASRQEKFDIVNYGYRSIDEHGKFIKRAVPQRREIYNLKEQPGRLLISEPHPTNKLWRRDLFTKYDIWFPEKAYWEDFATVPRLIFKAENITFIDKALYSYYDRQNSTVNSISDRHIMDFFRTLDEIKLFMLNDGIYEAEKADFDEIIRIVLGWYADRISASKTLNQKLARDSIRYCALLAGSYIAADDTIRSNSPAQNVDLIKRLARAIEPTVPIAHPEKPKGWLTRLWRSH